MIFNNMCLSTKADGVPIPRIRTEERGGNLTIKGLKKEDYGIYECVVKNDVATLLTSTLLIVEGKPTS